VHLPPEYVLIDEYTGGEGGSPIRVYEHRGSSAPDPSDLMLADGYQSRPYPHRDYRSWVGSLESFVDRVSFADYEGPAPDGVGTCHVATNVSVDRDHPWLWCSPSAPPRSLRRSEGIRPGGPPGPSELAPVQRTPLR
jgi:hypothetical protein